MENERAFHSDGSWGSLDGHVCTGIGENEGALMWPSGSWPGVEDESLGEVPSPDTLHCWLGRGQEYSLPACRWAALV